MPAVNFKVRWPDGRESAGYSPSTVIYQHLEAGGDYPLDEFMARAETALNAASERVKALKGFYCSSAMDTLASLQYRARRYEAGGTVHIVDMQTDHAERITAGWSSL